MFIHVTRPVFFWFLCGGKERRHQPLDLPVNDPAFTVWQSLYNQYDPVVPYFYYVSLTLFESRRFEFGYTSFDGFGITYSRSISFYFDFLFWIYIPWMNFRCRHCLSSLFLISVNCLILPERISQICLLNERARVEK